MKNNRITMGMFLLLLLSFLGSCSKNIEPLNQPVQDNQAVQNSQPVMAARSIAVPDSALATVSVFAPDIVYPRGLKFGPDGYLYVATAGTGGTNSTEGKCDQVVPPVGPYTGGRNAKILKISPGGEVTTVADSLPSTLSPEGVTMGVSDVEFVGKTLYALLVAGCSHGSSDFPSSVIKVNQEDGTWSVVADLSSYFDNNKVAAPEADDFEPDGTPYSMINVRGDLYVIEPNHGEMIKVTTDGKATRVLDFSAHYGHIVPTAVTFDGDFFVGNLRTFPLVGGSSSIYKVTPHGDVSVWATGFTGVLGVQFDKQDRLYVLEMSQDGGPTPMTGRVVRINKDGSRDIIAAKLMFPTGMTFGKDGALYVSNTGFGPPTGQILKLVVDGDNDHHDHNRDRDHGRNDRNHHNDGGHWHDN
jgi:hypothetical protein